MSRDETGSSHRFFVLRLQPCPLLEVKNLSVAFPTPDGPIKAVDGVSFTVEKGTTVGLVGESGSGKTTIGRALLKLTPSSATISGEVFYGGQEILSPARKGIPPVAPRGADDLPGPIQFA